jgi:hypothetical protein
MSALRSLVINPLAEREHLQQGQAHPNQQEDDRDRGTVAGAKKLST